jgi:hypothetical protein
MIDRPHGLTPRQAEIVKNALEVVTPRLISAPPPTRMGQRLAELREMGFADLPVEPGISSSLRCYAQATLDISAPCVFLATGDPELLKRADELERFGVRPITIEAAGQMPNAQPMLMAESLRQCAEKIVEQQLERLGERAKLIPPEVRAGVVREIEADLRRKFKVQS